jgi:hypothetical protein
MQQRFELLGGPLRTQNGGKVVGATRSRLQGCPSLLVEGMDRLAHRLFIAAQGSGDLGDRFPTRRCQQNLAATQHKGIRGTQPGTERLPFLFGKVADKNAGFHTSEYTTFRLSFLENALATNGAGSVSAPVQSQRMPGHPRDFSRCTEHTPASHLFTGDDLG